MPHLEPAPPLHGAADVVAACLNSSLSHVLPVCVTSVVCSVNMSLIATTLHTYKWVGVDCTVGGVYACVCVSVCVLIDLWGDGLSCELCLVWERLGDLYCGCGSSVFMKM